MRRGLRWLIILAVLGGGIYGFTQIPAGAWGWGNGNSSDYRQQAVTRGDVIAVVNSTGSPVNSGCWQRPQLGWSASLAAGTRLMDWQCGQTM